MNLVLRNAFNDMDKLPSGHVALEHLKAQVHNSVTCCFLACVRACMYACVCVSVAPFNICSDSLA